MTDEEREALINSRLAEYGNDNNGKGHLPALRQVTVAGVEGATDMDRVETIMELEQGGLPVTLIGGELPGRPARVTYHIPFGQLAPDDQAVLRSRYNPELDEGLKALSASIAEEGLIDPLTIVYRGEHIEIEGKQQPLYRVADLRRYYALVPLANNLIQAACYPECRFGRADATDKERLLRSFAAQATRKELSLFDQGHTCYQLAVVYGHQVRIIAKHTGMSESKVSRLVDAGALALKSQVIADYMLQDSLKLEHIARMNEGIPDDELDAAERVAEFTVQEQCSADRVARIVRGLFPDGGIAPYYALLRNSNSNLLELSNLASGDVDNADASLRGDNADHYWTRSQPLLVSDGQIVKTARSVHPVITGNGRRRSVSVASLGSFHFFQGRERDEQVSLEEAVLRLQADLEAVHAELQQRARQQASGNMLQLVAGSGMGS